MRTQLNTELALVLAQKDVVLRGVRKDFGRLSIAEDLAQSAQKTQNKKRAKASLQKAIEQALTNQQK